MRNQLIGTSRENNVTLLGAQGPSVFLHCRNMLKTNKTGRLEPSINFYHLLTTDKINKTFNRIAHYIKTQKDVRTKSVLTAYFRGYLNAYSLERNIQPYVYYFGGYSRSYLDKSVNQYLLNRINLETRLDILYEQSIKEKTPLKSIIRVNKDEVRMISEMFYHVAIDIYSLANISKNTFYYNYFRMRRDLKFFESNSYLSLRRLINKFRGSPYLSALKRTKRVERTDTYDFLNLRKNKWLHPTAGIEVDLTFSNLVTEAREETPFVNSIIKKLGQNIDISRDINNFCMNINYQGFQSGTEPIFWNIIFKENEDGTFDY